MENPGYPRTSTQYAPQQQKDYGGYQSQQQGYPPQGIGYVQQPDRYSSNMSKNTTVVVQNQQRVASTVIPVVDDRMGLAIFACLCCCWPIGILAVRKSSEARNRYMAGDYAGAVESAKSSRNLSCAAIICGLIIIPLIIVLKLVVFPASSSSSNDYNI